MNIVKSNFYGIDASNEISLLEYGLLVYSEKHEDNSGTQFCVYKIDENSFGTGHYSNEEINDLLNGNDWASNEDIKSFLSYVGADNIEQYIANNDIAMKLNDLKSYFGTETIFGTDYYPMTEDEAIKLYL